MGWDGWIDADEWTGLGADKLDGHHEGKGMHGVNIVLCVFLHWSLAPANMPCFICSVRYSLLLSHVRPHRRNLQ